MQWLSKLLILARRQFSFQNDLLVIVMVIVPILLFLSLAGQPASAALPAAFLECLICKKILSETHEVVNATDLLRALLPVKAFELLCGGVPDFLDKTKWNRVPVVLNPIDAFLRIAVFGGSTKNFRIFQVCITWCHNGTALLE